jgi:sulfur transfer complex TusBCD TusB component (DsrH family)
VLIEIEGEEIKAEIQRTTYDVMAASDAVSARGLPGDVYRAATIRTGKLVR